MPSCLKFIEMNRLITTIAFLVFILGHLVAQENALFWEINKKKHKTSYLYGTIHVVDQRAFDFGEEVLPALYKCKAYAGEIIMQPEDAFAIIPYLFERDKSKRCKTVLSEEEYAKLEKVVEERLGKEMRLFLPSMSPYIAALLLLSPTDFSDNPQTLFLDQYLQEKADSLGKTLIGLERIKSQMAYIQNIEIEAQKTYLLKVLEEDNAEADFEKIIAIYLAEDLEKIQELIVEASKEDPLISDEFLIGRNYIHVEGIMTAMKKQSTFVAIGAAHLPGEEGVIALLRKEGFTVRPIPKK